MALVGAPKEGLSARGSAEVGSRSAIAPNFLIIGAARSGTTTLYHYLQSHPDVYLPRNKRPEPHFFLKSAEYAKGFPYYLERYFGDCGDQRARGEASTSYICHDWVAERIQRHLPEVKLIALLRNPVERAYSSYWHTVKAGLETRDFEDAVRLEKERLANLSDPVLQETRPYAYIERGCYYRQISDYLRYFPRHRLFLALFEDFVQCPQSVMDEVFRFLDVRPWSITPASVEVFNQSTPTGRKVSQRTREYLIDCFRQDIRLLEELLHRDLSSWLTTD